MSDSVTITRTPGAQNATFETINASQSQMVFWKNRDDQPHWPSFGGVSPALTLPYQVGAHGNSSSLQPATVLTAYYGPNGPNPFPQGQALPVPYTCSLHAGESGTIYVYADFFSSANQLAPATRGKAYTANLTTGGMPPYQFTISNSNLPACLTVQNVAGQGPVLMGTPGPNDAGNFAFDLNCQDSDTTNIIQTFLLTIA